jgi:hypothetical protein
MFSSHKKLNNYGVFPAPELVQMALNPFVINKSFAKSWSKIVESCVAKGLY